MGVAIGNMIEPFVNKEFHEKDSRFQSRKQVMAGTENRK